MPDGLLQGHLAAERAEAVRWMLGHPLLDSRAEPEAFRLVARHVPWLTTYFEDTCGWALAVDASSGFARLAKRPVEVDVSRPLRRHRGERAPFDRRRYQLLCLVCAELVRNPVTTISLLARSVTAEGALDSSRQSERSAFVDALSALTEWGALRCRRETWTPSWAASGPMPSLAPTPPGSTGCWSAPLHRARCPMTSTPSRPPAACSKNRATAPPLMTPPVTYSETRPATVGPGTA